MLIILDNAESILDPQGTDAQRIFATVEQLSQFDNLWLGITSRIAVVPPACETLFIPTLSAEAARDAFYRIHQNDEQSDLTNNILKQLDFHPLSITLLATVAHQNRWDAGRLTKEWERQRTYALHAHHDESLAATIEHSLASPLFQELGPDARELLGVVAFFPQGVDENNLEWLFPTVPNRITIFDNFCILSLTYRSNGFVTMLTPLREYLCPKGPKLSPILCKIKELYFDRLSVGVYPGRPSYEEAQWIESEDVNIEHLLDVFTTIDTGSDEVWDICGYFMDQLGQHKPRLVLLGPKIEALPDAHPSKPRCLFELSKLFNLVGNHLESRRLLIHTLKLWRERGDEPGVAQTLRWLSDADRILGLQEEGIQWPKEVFPDALESPPSDDDSDNSVGGTLWAIRDPEVHQHQQQKPPGPGPLPQVPPSPEYLPPSRRITSTNNADMLWKRSTELWGIKVRDVTFEQVKNASSALSAAAERPSGSKRAFRGKRSGLFELTFIVTATFKWVRGKLIGKGTYGKVYVALNATTGDNHEKIAVKQVEIPRTENDKNDSHQVTVVEALKLESETLKGLDHQNIVQYFGFEETQKYLSMLVIASAYL